MIIAQFLTDNTGEWHGITPPFFSNFLFAYIILLVFCWQIQVVVTITFYGYMDTNTIKKKGKRDEISGVSRVWQVGHVPRASLEGGTTEWF